MLAFSLIAFINRRTDFHIIQNEALIGQRYRKEILRSTAVLYAAAIGDNFMLMDDNCKPHHIYFMDISFF